MEYWKTGMLISPKPNLPSFHHSNIPVSEPPLWLFSRRADFWFACGGASLGLLAALVLIFFHGDRQLDAVDLVLSEFHIGATYDAVLRRRLWRNRQVDVVWVPLVILALTYALWMSGQTIWLTSIAMYAAVWHRGRQSLGVARFYQRGMGGPVSRTHDSVFRGAIYLPMLAATLAYTHLAPTEYDGEPYVALSVGAEMTSTLGIAAALSVIAYLAWTLQHNAGARLIDTTQHVGSEVHPAEWWVVLAHAVAFGSGYLLGASNASFLFVLAVHHEVQYLYFTYAMARRSGNLHGMEKAGRDFVTEELASKVSVNAGPVLRSKVKFAASFLRWPVIAFIGAMAGGWFAIPWLAPLGVGGLFCHYWFDSRIWTRRSFHA